MIDQESTRVCVCSHPWGLHRGRCYGRGWRGDGECLCEAFIATKPPELVSDQPGVAIYCYICSATALLPYADDARSMVAIAPLEGWSAPPTRCPDCSDQKAARTSE